MSFEIQPQIFKQQFERFKALIASNGKGHEFVDFTEGVAAAMEGYKPRVRSHALELLDYSSWKADDVGSGTIIESAIASIEIDDRKKNLNNNLVLWQNLWGHANRDHRGLLEARADSQLCRKLEELLFALFRTEADEGVIFDDLAELTHKKYPLVGYLYFLKDMDRFMQIRPTAFDQAFNDLRIDLVTVRQCSWANYSQYNSALLSVRRALEEIAGVPNVRLIDAHSFCWLLIRLEPMVENASESTASQSTDPGRILGSRDKSILEMKYSTLQTVKRATGRTREQSTKVKELRMTEEQLEGLLRHLMTQQEDRCALTGLPFQFRGTHEDENMLPSLDRIDSSGHYEAGNLQIVCRFINFWKQDADNEEFKRLLMCVRGIEE